jgi:hypothetical protein
MPDTGAFGGFLSVSVCTNLRPFQLFDQHGQTSEWPDDSTIARLFAEPAPLEPPRALTTPEKDTSP